MNDDTEIVNFEVIAERPKTRNRRRRAIVLGALVAGASIARVTRRMQRRRAAAEAPADLGFMLAMHDAMRRDLERLERATAIDGPTSSHVEDGFEQLRKELLSHHAAEDDDLWPVLRSRVTDRRDVDAIDAMYAEHARIPAALDAVSDALSRGDGAKVAVATLTELVRAHLEHEERDVLPLVRSHLSDIEWHDFLRKERNKQPMRERVDFLTWVLDDASPADEAAVLSELPPPGRVVYRRVLRPRYERRELWAVDA